MNAKSLIASAAAMLTAAGTASAVQEIQFDCNAMTARSSSAFSTAYTGNLRISNDLTIFGGVGRDANAELLRVLLDGIGQAGSFRDTNNFLFDMSINFVGGLVSGGTVSIAVSDNTYTASLNAAIFPSIIFDGSSYTIAGLTMNGNFANGGTFAGVSVAPFFAQQPLSGRFANFFFEPNANNMDNDVDVDVKAIIPLPNTAGLAAVGMMALGFAGRRRRD